MRIWIGLFLLFSPATLYAQTSLKNFLCAPEKISLDGQDYGLSWSSKPSDHFRIQEYLPKGETSENFKSMVTLNLVTSNETPKFYAEQKIRELEQKKKSDPVIQFKIYENPKLNEAMVDFIISASANGKLTIVEQGLYRYHSVKLASGKMGVLLFGVSSRAYDDKIETFLKNLSSLRAKKIKSITSFTLPEVKECL